MTYAKPKGKLQYASLNLSGVQNRIKEILNWKLRTTGNISDFIIMFYYMFATPI